MKTDKFNQGFTLVELMVVIGLMGGVAVFAMKMAGVNLKQSKTAETAHDITSLVSEIRNFLGKSENCTATFQNLNIVTGANVGTLKDGGGNDRYETLGINPDAHYGNVYLKLVQFDIGGPDPAYQPDAPSTPYSGVATLDIRIQRPQTSYGTPEISKKIKLAVNLKDNTVPAEENELIDCRALGGNDSPLWQQGVGTAIYYDGGYVGIGSSTDDPAAHLHVNGNIRVDGIVNAQVYLYTSDERAKSQITSITEPERILKVQGRRFIRNSNQHEEYGVIAQELKEVYPELVYFDESQDQFKVNIQGLIAPLIEMIKKQQRTIDQLQKDVNQLRMSR